MIQKRSLESKVKMICLRLVSIRSGVIGTAPGLFIAVRKTYISMNFEIYKSKYFIDFKVKISS